MGEVPDGKQAADDALAVLRDSDAMVMGRVTYEYFAGTWPAATGPYADRVNGFGRLARTLLAHDLVDEVDFSVFPVLVGDGVPLFRPAPATHLRLRSAQARSSGVVSLSYAPVGR